jgi:hypothetical protein
LCIWTQKLVWVVIPLSVLSVMVHQGYVLDISESRFHHEIYLSDARKVAPEKLKTVIRHPIK